MEDAINFCPYCDASQHKIMQCRGSVFYCKECSKFFEHRVLNFKCPRCGRDPVTKSDFPSPAGEPIFQCKSCKKMFGAAEFFEENGLGRD